MRLNDSPFACEYRRARPLLGTLAEVRVQAASGTQAEAALSAAFAALAQVHRLMSPHEPGSDLYRLNHAPVDVPVPLDPHTLAVLTCAAALQRDSGGAFDCECGSAPAAANGGAAWHIEGDAVRKQRVLRLDLGGIAKGYAVDLAIEALRGFGLARAVVNAGGDLRHVGRDPVPVWLREPACPRRVARRMLLDNAALASSASGGLGPGRLTASLIVDRRTGLRLLPGAGATVLAPQCMLADALAKVVLVDAAPEHPLLSRHGACALLYRSGGRGPA
ncbi:FAD:protein FMN transferase [Cupriavidus sp. SK-4]|uniref:FAD:protein FMN transferase n=1 Tax=Cupriavidus sp. SK-4 TaxID=574750 RepID=UPI00068FF095|nr:FAD:protein FMN transferase [Cupriavidus sp. SK-4]